MPNEFSVIFIGRIRNLDSIVPFAGGGIRIVNVLKYLIQKGIQVKFIHLDDSPSFINRSDILKNFWLIYTFKKLREQNCIILEDYIYRLNTFIFNFWILTTKKAKPVALLNALSYFYYKSELKKFIDKILSIIFFCFILKVIYT